MYLITHLLIIICSLLKTQKLDIALREQFLVLIKYWNKCEPNPRQNWKHNETQLQETVSNN